MHHVWLKQTAEARDVIVIFGGWAVGSDVIMHLESKADILLISDYRDLDYRLPDLSSYQTRTLVAWSFGVASYGHWQKDHPEIFSRKVAINGTMRPIDPDYGIAPEVMQKTIDNLSEDSFQMFLMRVHNGKVPDQKIDVAARKSELVDVWARGDSPPQTWERIWISRKDRIFPYQSQMRAWALQIDAVKCLDAAHAPFDEWAHWSELCT